MSAAERYAPSRWVKVRLYFSASLIACCFGGLGWRAYVLQVRESDRLKAMAEDQYLKDVELPPKRGRILDRNGVELAASTEVDSVHVNARMLIAANSVVATADALADALHLDRHELERKPRARRYFTWVKRRIAPEEARAVRELQLPGVYLDREPRRYYPNRALAGPLLGWAGLDARGQEGIELEYERYLRGARAQLPGLRDALGRAVLIGGLGDSADVAGHDLYTTIDRYIQFRLERALDKGVTAHHAKAGVAVALDPNNGDILAMAAVPSLNPNEPDGAREHGARNRAVTDPFEPGSTMKAFTIAGALESGAIHVDDNWWCENGHWSVGGHATIHDDEPIGDVTTAGVLAKSSNICAAKIAAKEGRDQLHEILLRFGFGQRTGVDLPGERAGQVRSAERMGPVETATMAFGQGLTATPLQIATAYAAIANGGTLYRPHVMRRILSPEGQTVQEGQVVGRRVISPELAATMRSLLHAVTQKGGTAQKLSVPGYLFAGKTGTAQKVDPVTRHYSPTSWAASFVGFAPYQSPRIVLYVMIDEPYGSHHGSGVAGPVWQDVMIDALRWMGVPPTEPLVAANDAAGAEKKAPKVVEPPTIDEPEDASEAQPVVDDEADAARREVPDFAGMSMAEALQAARRAGVRLEVIGSGRATGAVAWAGGAQARRRLHRVVYTAGLRCKRVRHDTSGPGVAGLCVADCLQPVAGVRLAQLLDGVEVVGVDGGGAAALELEVGEVRDDSRAVERGDLFVATRGQTVDGHDYLGRAAERGAVAAVVDADAAQGFPGVRVRVRAPASALGTIAANRWGRPADALTMIAVTGTNGKTTTTFLVEGLVRAAGGAPGVLGTVTYRFGSVVRESPFTTPTPLVLHATLAEMRAAGVTHVAMEASSHALELGRLAGVRFRVAAFTNLTQDHLDFHGTMQAYAESKARLFREHLTDDGVGVVNLDNEWGAFMLQEVRGRALAVATSGVPDVLLMRSEQTVDGIDAELMTPIGAVRLRSPLIGAFNLENLAVGVGIGVGLGLTPDQIARGLGSVRGVPGRVERVDNERGFGVFVDYAHTPDALERVMAALRPLARGRLIVVFGCGGDRDKTKRPKMGRAVARDADLPIVTSDNPRTEEPGAIIGMILDGVRELRASGFVVEGDRRRAIAAAIEAARPGDIVLIAGKGHEDYQILGKEKHHFDDREEARAALAKLANLPANGQS